MDRGKNRRMREYILKYIPLENRTDHVEGFDPAIMSKTDMLHHKPRPMSNNPRD